MYIYVCNYLVLFSFVFIVGNLSWFPVPGHIRVSEGQTSCVENGHSASNAHTHVKGDQLQKRRLRLENCVTAYMNFGRFLMLENTYSPMLFQALQAHALHLGSYLKNHSQKRQTDRFQNDCTFWHTRETEIREMIGASERQLFCTALVKI